MVRFRNEDRQNEFLGELEQRLLRGDFASAGAFCEDDRRAVAQLALLAISQRDLGLSKLRQMVAERFQRDFLAPIDYRMSWVNSMIKCGPMLGLWGTVLGMMGAFGKLAATNKVEPALLAADISLALVTTALGLLIAIPLTVIANSVTVRIRQMEDLVGAGLARLFDGLKNALERH